MRMLKLTSEKSSWIMWFGRKMNGFLVAKMEAKVFFQRFFAVHGKGHVQLL